MLSLGLTEGKSVIVPVMLMGIPFRVPSVLLMESVLSEYTNCTEGFEISCPHPLNSGLFISPVITGLLAVPFTERLAVISPLMSYRGASGIMLSTRFMSRPAILAVSSMRGVVSIEPTFPLM